MYWVTLAFQLKEYLQAAYDHVSDVSVQINFSFESVKNVIISKFI